MPLSDILISRHYLKLQWLIRGKILQVFLVISYQLKLQVITLWSRQEIRCKIKDTRNVILWTMWLFICDFLLCSRSRNDQTSAAKKTAVSVAPFTSVLSHLVTVYAAALWPTLLDLLDSCHVWKCKGIGNETSHFKPQKKKHDLTWELRLELY